MAAYRDCAFCDVRPAKEGIDYCEICDAVLTARRLHEEALEMEKDGILTEEDDLHGSNTGC